jgi:putative restriction endonuclease
MKDDHGDPSIAGAFAAIERLNTWQRQGERAPNKPMLLLVALRRVQQGAPRLTDFNDLEGPLRELLEKFGPERSHVHPEYPFWRLQRDGLWEVENAAEYPTRRSNAGPSVGVLRDRHARGGFTQGIYDGLRANRGATIDLAETIATKYFPERVDSVLEAVGINRSPR